VYTHSHSYWPLHTMQSAMASMSVYPPCGASQLTGSVQAMQCILHHYRHKRWEVHEISIVAYCAMSIIPSSLTDCLHPDHCYRSPHCYHNSDA